MRKTFSVFKIFLATLILLTCQLSEAKKVKVAMFTWWGMSDADKGFVARLKELGVDADVKIQDLNQDKGKMGQIYRDTKWTDYDFVYTYGTTASKGAAAAIGGAVPQIFAVVSYPVEAGLVNSMDKSGKKITGSSNLVPVPKMYDAVLKVKALKSVGIMFNPIEENAEISRADFEKASAVHGIKTTAYRTGSDVEQIKKIAAEIVADYKAGKIDGLFLPSATFYTSNAAKFMPIFAEGGVFSFTAIDKMAETGATMGILFDRGKLGRMAADRLKEILDGKVKIEESKILFDETPQIVFNKLSVEKTGIKPPAGAKMIP